MLAFRAVDSTWAECRQVRQDYPFLHKPEPWYTTDDNKIA
jgi:hypothetical protein